MPNRSLVKTVSATLLAGLLLVGCDGTQTMAVAPAGAPAPAVDVITVTSQPVNLVTELSGRTSAYRIAEVRPRVTGIVLERLFEEGSDVTAGQLLYRIDPTRYEAEVASAEAELAKARATEGSARLKAKRYAELQQRQAVSQQDHDDARASWKQHRAEVAAALAALERARIDLSHTEIRAPIAGRIGRSDVTEGALVTAEQTAPLTRIQQLDRLYVDMRQSTADLLRLRRALADGSLVAGPDERAEIRLLLEDGSRYDEPGSLQFSDVSVDEGTGMVNLRAEVPNPDQLLLPGMFVRGLLVEGQRPEGILLPQAGVTRTPNGGATVLLVGSDNSVELRPVTLGRAIDGHWLIESGIEEGARVIVAGIQKVRPGMTVTPNESSGVVVRTTNKQAQDS